VDVSEELEEPTPPESPKPKRTRRRTTDAPKPRQSKIERRGEQAATLVRDLIHLRRPDLDIGDMTFLEVVDRDADAWGKLLAWIGMKVEPFGQLLDTILGAPVAVLLKLAPSVRAARRDLSTRRVRKQQERTQEQEPAPEYDEHGNLIVPQGWQGE
jgi:hypothetical protein